MAIATIKIPNDLLKKIEALGENSGPIIDKCVEAGAKVVEKHVRENLRGKLSAGHQNGELINALGVSPVKVNANGVHNAKVGFSENRSDGKRNGMIAAIFENGRSPNKSGKAAQPPRPFMAPAKTQSKKSAVEAMERVFDEEAEKA